METYLPTCQEHKLTSANVDGSVSTPAYRKASNSGCGSVVYRKELADQDHKLIVGTSVYDEILVDEEELAGWEVEHEQLDL